jgi:hypothetical protein
VLPVRGRIMLNRPAILIVFEVARMLLQVRTDAAKTEGRK